MKTTLLRSAFLAATLILPAAAHAADTPVAADARSTPEQVRRFDTNGDGRLDRQERRAAREQRRAERTEGRPGLQARRLEFDQNGDGQLDATEQAAWEAALRAEVEKRPRAMARFDQDKDGKLSEAEWAAARTAWAERAERRAESGPPRR